MADQQTTNTPTLELSSRPRPLRAPDPSLEPKMPPLHFRRAQRGSTSSTAEDAAGAVGGRAEAGARRHPPGENVLFVCTKLQLAAS